MVPEGHDADAFRKAVLENFDMSLGTGLGQAQGQVRSGSAISGISTT